MKRENMLKAICVVDENNGDKIKLSDMPFVEDVLSDEALTKLYNSLKAKEDGRIGTFELIRKGKKK